MTELAFFDPRQSFDPKALAPCPKGAQIKPYLSSRSGSEDDVSLDLNRLPGFGTKM